MKIFNKFVKSSTEPSNKNDVWFDGSVFRIYEKEEWQAFTLDIDTANKIAEIINNAFNVYQEKLIAGKGIIIEDNIISTEEHNELFEIVSELPSTPKDNTIYLVSSLDGEENNILTEYICIDGIWEKFGEFKAGVDLSGYIKAEDVTVIKGDAKNSAVLKGTYFGKSNKAISENSVSLGVANTAGLAGWYYSNIDFVNKTITLSLTQPHLENGVLVGGSWDARKPKIYANDEISIINNSIYDLKSKVTAVNENVITVDSLPFDSYANVSIESQDVHDWVIYVPANPNNGLINLGFASLSEGINTKATAPGAHSEGLETHAYGHYSHTEGRDTMAGYAAHAEGRRSIAKGEHSHAQGLSTIAEGDNSFSTGRDTKAYGTNSSALGYKSESHGENSLSSGITSKAKGVNSVALGNNVNAEGDNTFAEGNNTINKGNSSHTEGLFSKVDVVDSDLTDRFHRQNGYASHAEGYTSLAVGCGAHSEGMLTKAIGSGSHSEGYRTIAKAGSSHAEGSYTETKNSSEHAEGKYNVSNEGKTIHSVGIGTSSKRKNAHEIMQDGKHYVYGIGGYDGTNPDSSDDLATVINNMGGGMINVTHTELVQLRNNSQLKQGMFYRITDYVTTTTQENTQSAGHQFDIIVLALNESKLSEQAYAAIHEGDTYFTENGANLAAWKVWYCLDNDSTRFAWADAENGKGVIYRLIDEWNNDCPYDFKNIMFERGIYAEGGGIEKEEDDGDYEVFCYTFSWEDKEKVIMDASIVGNNGTKLNDEGFAAGVYGNVIKSYFAYTGSHHLTKKCQLLNDIVFFSTYGYEDGLFYGCNSNTFGDGCNSNTFGDDCYSNTFGKGCYFNTFGQCCYFNTFGDSCRNNTLGDRCNSNTLGTACENNTLGTACENNTFWDKSHNNTFGDSCSDNTFFAVFRGKNVQAETRNMYGGIDSEGTIVLKNIFD